MISSPLFCVAVMSNRFFDGCISGSVAVKIWTPDSGPGDITLSTHAVLLSVSLLDPREGGDADKHTLTEGFGLLLNPQTILCCGAA